MDRIETEKIVKGIVGDQYELVEEVPLEAIDEAKSARYQVRDDMTDPELVERYGIAMLDGAEFPPIILSRLGGGKFECIDGNNRRAAKKEIDEKTVAAFVLGPGVTDLQIEILRVALNEHGKPHTKEERLREVARLVAMGMSQKDAAQLGRLKVSALEHYIAVQRGKKRLTEAGVSARVRESLSESSVLRIGSLRENNVVKLAAEIALEFGVRVDEVSKFVAQLAALRSEPARMSELKAWREELMARLQSDQRSGESRKARKSSPYSNFMKGAGLILREPSSEVLRTASDRALLRERVTEVAYRCSEILGRKRE